MSGGDSFLVMRVTQALSCCAVLSRKCAGTTLKSYLTGLAQQFRVRFMEAEGESLQRCVGGSAASSSFFWPLTPHLSDSEYSLSHCV